MDLPKFVKLNGTELRLRNKNEYWRDAGYWGVFFIEKENKLYSVSDMYQLNSIELIPITEYEWREGNKGYI